MKLTKRNVKQFKEKFLELRDPTGAEFADKYLKGYSDLQRLLKFVWFSRAWEEWQEDLRASIKSQALKRIQEISEEGSAQSLNAAKYLANGEYIEGAKPRGRPTKQEVQGELKRQVEAVEQRKEDYHRMVGNMKVITGGRASILGENN